MPSYLQINKIHGVGTGINFPCGRDTCQMAGPRDERARVPKAPVKARESMGSRSGLISELPSESARSRSHSPARSQSNSERRPNGTPSPLSGRAKSIPLNFHDNAQKTTTCASVIIGSQYALVSDQNGHDVPSRSAHAKVPTQWTPRAANVKKNNLARARLRSTDATLPSTAVTHAAPAHAKLS